MHDLRLFKNMNWGINAFILLFNQTTESEPFMEIDIFSGSKQSVNISNHASFGTVRILNRSNERIENFPVIGNGDIFGSKNNFLWRSIKSVFNSGYLILMLGLDASKLTIINNQITNLTTCHDQEICMTQKRCLRKSSTNAASVGVNELCESRMNLFWESPIRKSSSLCCEDSELESWLLQDTNPMCNFNHSIVALSLPSHFEILAERFGQYRAPSVGQPVGAANAEKSGISIITLKDEAVTWLKWETPQKFREDVSKTLLEHKFDRKTYFTVEFCRQNSTFACISQVKTNPHHGLVFEDLINDDKNTIIILASYPCGTCQILVRIIQQIQMYLSFNLSTPNQNRLRFLHLDVRKNQVPVILQFDRLPQLLVYPKTSDGFKVKKICCFRYELRNEL